ncbi:adenylosuccinate lyase [SAR202 cluster bacterium AC-409-J13_OGT_754m]|nr:adenylosuccinate lyase [SAR202 cluster bacterium AC-409-J13_OGT_754m]
MKKVWSDENKYLKWLQVELAVCEAWTKVGIIPEEDMIKLRHATFDMQIMDETFKETRHDVTAFLKSVTTSLGPEGRWVHLGLTSSDVIDTALSLQLLESSDILKQDLLSLIKVLKQLAKRYQHTLMMGRTHGVHAEPITFGLKMALWWTEMNRQLHRLEAATADIAVGKISGAVGTHATVTPQVESIVCDMLNIEAAPVSNQIVQRDRHAMFVLTLALIASSLEKFATEIRALQKTEVREVQEPFGESQTGSSAMPHKRNPELSERVCGLARLIRGHSVTALENVALWHERDISHSSAERIILPDACLALDYSMDIFTWVMQGLKVYPERMQHNIELGRGLVFSQGLMLALVNKGLQREKAYRIVQAHAMKAWDNDQDFMVLSKSDPIINERLTTQELDSIFDYSFYSRHVGEVFDRIGI